MPCSHARSDCQGCTGGLGRRLRRPEDWTSHRRALRDHLHGTQAGRRSKRTLCSPCQRSTCRLAVSFCSEGERRAQSISLAASLIVGLHVLCPAAPAEAFQLEDIKEATSDVEKSIQDKLQALTPVPPSKPENVFERILQPNTKDAKQKQEVLNKEREQKQREREEKRKREKIEKEQERIKKERDRLFRQQAILGGSALGLGALFIGKWQAVAAGAAILFRTLGGPTIMSNVLRTPGLLFGRSLHVVEWDVARSPRVPNGRVVSFKLRALTPVGLRQAIVRNCGLGNAREVKQMCHWIQCGPGFCEPLTTVPSFRMLADPSWIVWSRQPKKGLDTIPYRLDEHEIAMQEQNPFGALMPQQELELMIRTINAAAAITRGDRPPGIQRPGLGQGMNGRREASPLFYGDRSASDTAMSSRNAASRLGQGARSSGNGAHASQSNGADDAGDSVAQRSYCEETEREVNQAAIAQLRSLERGSSSDSGTDGEARSAAAETAKRSAPTAVDTVTAPVKQLSHSFGEAVADSVAATRDALGVPDENCQPSAADLPRGNTPGPSTGGRGAEFRETPAQLDRYQIAAAAMEELLGNALPRAGPDPISRREEERLVAAAVASADGARCGLRHLFRIYAKEDVVSFLRFGRALVSADAPGGMSSGT